MPLSGGATAQWGGKSDTLRGGGGGASTGNLGVFLVPKFHFFFTKKKSLFPISRYLDFSEGLGFFFRNHKKISRSFFTGYSYMGFTPQI